MMPKSQSSAKNLWGSKGRFIGGTLTIVCGLFEISLAVCLILLPLRRDPTETDSLDYVGWGIWNGLLAIIAGFFGVYSHRGKCLVITYMVLSIVAAMSSAACIIGVSISASILSSNYYYYDYGERINTEAHMTIYIVMCILCGLQIPSCIVGAGFTCGALCPSCTGDGDGKVQVNPVIYYRAS